ncbi:hypothetical protein CRG98_032175 [Punica granatum]|uniref:Uncharacterized protein n=1 Tax=Punica granatum TaxID=22663 RepID=A0A2I0ITV9_PUNGR|nr:hypothetical protein CRG98_032175 [Punica granatum]
MDATFVKSRGEAVVVTINWGLWGHHDHMYLPFRLRREEMKDGNSMLLEQGARGFIRAVQVAGEYLAATDRRRL